MTEESDNNIDTDLRKRRREVNDEEWRENPLKKYIEKRSNEAITHQFSREKTRLERLQKYLQETIPHDGAGLRDATESDIKSFIEQELKQDPNITNTTIVDYLSDYNHFYKTIRSNYAIRDNPIESPLEEFRKNNTVERSPDRPYIPFEHMKEYVNWLSTPFGRSTTLLGLKHGTRSAETVNTDLRCLHIAHPVFYEIVNRHDIKLDPRVRDKPDSIVIYEQFNEGDQVPNENTPGTQSVGEIRDHGNKRKEKNGSILPIDSELKTALIEYLLVRLPTYSKDIHPLFTWDKKNPKRVRESALANRLWRGDHPDSIKNFSEERSISECPNCGSNVEEENVKRGNKTGRQYYCTQCGVTHYRTIHWDNGLSTPQKVTFHQFRHYFSDAHRENKSEIHDGEMSDWLRKKRIRGDAIGGDTDDTVYSHKQHESWEEDVRKPYLEAIYKFDLYNNPVPAYGEGWDK